MVVVRNLTPALITITNGVKIAQVMDLNAIPQVRVVTLMLEKLENARGPES